MRLQDAHYDNRETGCCARVDTARWDGKTHAWKDKPFLKDHMRSFLHIPLNFGSVITRDHAVVERAEAWPEEPFWLTDEVSPWGADIYTAVDRDIPGANMARLTGTFVTRVFQGPYRDIGKWMHEIAEDVRGKGMEMKKVYFFYATCPNCAEKLGANQVVMFAQVQ